MTPNWRNGHGKKAITSLKIRLKSEEKGEEVAGVGVHVGVEAKLGVE